jgi:glycogen debranching enzyme
MSSRACLLPVFVLSLAVVAESPAPSFAPVPLLLPTDSGLVIRAHAEPLKPFTVAGTGGVLVGEQNGVFESWVLPVKLISHFTIEADVEGYGVPIDVNSQSAEIEVHPDRTILTYSHPAFTLRQIMFSPEPGQPDPANTGPIVLFAFDCLHPTDFTFRFTPELRWMWPERSEGTPSAEWVSPNPEMPDAAGGFYVLHADYPDLAGALTIPGATHGILAPYQERPQTHPVELKLHIDPAQDRGRLFPLLMAAGMSSSSATGAALGATLSRLNEHIGALYQANSEFYRKLLEGSTSIDTPDKALNDAFGWAVVSIEQLRAKAHARPDQADSASGNETALVAGYFTSADSARPGFGWFFGRDALYTLYAVNGFGDFALSRSELEFLIRRQRSDGKIMHEYSQTAPALDWRAFPYMYAAADSTPLFLLAVADYARSSGDIAFLTDHRAAIEKAWAFETDPAHDTDHDGIYDNSQGTGWVESWPGGMPHQEIYLALLDQQASSAMSAIEELLGDSAQAASARQRAEAVATRINAEYYGPQKGCYAFAINPAGSPNSPVDRTATIYPALAWWDPAGGRSILEHGDECLRRFAASALNTDWGLRDVADTEHFYDGLSYHQGSVWPLFTGWAALAEYRAGQSLAGYQLLMENANLTWAQDLGADTELLSGDFFVPFGRSTSHQLWSSAMVITPALRGLFGLTVNVQDKTLKVNPHLPAAWDHAAIRHLVLPGGDATLNFDRSGSFLEVSATGPGQNGFRLRTDLPGAAPVRLGSRNEGLRIPLPPFGLSVPYQAPLPGARTQSARVLSEKFDPARASFIFEGPAGTSATYELVRHAPLPHLKIESETGSGTNPQDPPAAQLSSSNQGAAKDPSVPLQLTVRFPGGSGFQTATVQLTW